MPITALRVTPPSSLAIWLALWPSPHIFFRVSTRSSVQDIGLPQLKTAMGRVALAVRIFWSAPILIALGGRDTSTRRRPGREGIGMNDTSAMGVRRFGRVNWLGLYTLAERETRRFLAVWTQTLLAPLVTSALFLSIFTLAIGPARGRGDGRPVPAISGPRHPDDDGDPERLCQYIIVTDGLKGAGQHRRHADAAAVAVGAGGRLYLGHGAARDIGGAGDMGSDGDLHRRGARASDLGAGFRRAGRDVSGRAWPDCRDLRDEIRSDGRDHQFHHHAAVVPVRHLLFDRQPAAAGQDADPLEPGLLPDRRGALRHDRDSPTARPGWGLSWCRRSPLRCCGCAGSGSGAATG